MTQVKAKKNDRLDSIVFEYYGSLENFGKVLEANVHLQNKVILNDGDIVYLPFFEKVAKKEVKALW